ncbi:unnamed protein product [Mortierella alpina]
MHLQPNAAAAVTTAEAGTLKAQSSTDPQAILTLPKSSHLKEIYDAYRMTQSSLDGSGLVPSVQLRHPTLHFSVPFANEGTDQDSMEVGATWQAQVERAVAVAAAAFGAPDPRRERQQPPAVEVIHGVSETAPLQPIE